MRATRASPVWRVHVCLRTAPACCGGPALARTATGSRGACGHVHLGLAAGCGALHAMRWHAQVVIMTTPLAAFFKCQYQDGYMWLFAIGVGSGSLLVSLLTKLLTRCARSGPPCS